RAAVGLGARHLTAVGAARHAVAPRAQAGRGRPFVAGARRALAAAPGARPVKWILIALALLLACVALLAIVGALLPVAHTAARRIRLQQPPEAVFALIA